MADSGVFGPWPVNILEVVGTVVCGAVALAIEGVRSMSVCGFVFAREDFPRCVGGGLIAFFPGDEVNGGIVEDLVEDLVAIDSTVDDEGQHALGIPLEAGAQPADERRETGTQVVVVVGAFEVDGVSFGGVDIVTVDEFIGPPDSRAPAFEDALHAGVMSGMGVVVEVVFGGVGGELLVVPAQHGVDGGGIGQAGELLALGGRLLT